MGHHFISGNKNGLRRQTKGIKEQFKNTPSIADMPKVNFSNKNDKDTSRKSFEQYETFVCFYHRP